MMRRACVLLAALALTACGATTEPAPDAPATALSSPDTDPPPPNVLWIVAEDHGPHHGSYGDTYAVTPNLDRLAAEGARFTRAFAVTPVCAPARSGDRHRHVPDVHRLAPHALDRGAAAARQGLHRTAARGRVLHDQQRQDRLQLLAVAADRDPPRGARSPARPVGPERRARALAQPGAGAAVLLGVQPRRVARRPGTDAGRPFRRADRGVGAGGPPRSGRGAAAAVLSGRPGGPPGRRALLRPGHGDGRRGGRDSRRARGRRAGRRHGGLLLRRPRLGAAARQALGLRLRTARAAARPLAGPHRARHGAGRPRQLHRFRPDPAVARRRCRPGAHAGPRLPGRRRGARARAPVLHPRPDGRDLGPHPRGPRSPLQVHPELRPRTSLCATHRLHGPDADDAGLAAAGGGGCAGGAATPFHGADEAGGRALRHRDRPARSDQSGRRPRPRGAPRADARRARRVDRDDRRPGRDSGDRPGAALPPRGRLPDGRPAEGGSAGRHVPLPADGGVDLSTEGATIEYTTEPGEAPRWKLYAGPFRMLDWELRFRCGRLGYFDSETVQYDFHIDYNWW